MKKEVGIVKLSLLLKDHQVILSLEKMKLGIPLIERSFVPHLFIRKKEGLNDSLLGRR